MMKVMAQEPKQKFVGNHWQTAQNRV